MVEKVFQISEWHRTENKLLHVSPHKQHQAKKIIIADDVSKQLPLLEEHNTLLAQVPAQVWSQHKNDIGLV